MRETNDGSADVAPMSTVSMAPTETPLMSVPVVNTETWWMAGEPLEVTVPDPAPRVPTQSIFFVSGFITILPHWANTQPAERAIRMRIFMVGSY
jgi:hypothetical protein